MSKLIGFAIADVVLMMLVWAFNIYIFEYCWNTLAVPFHGVVITYSQAGAALCLPFIVQATLKLFSYST